MEEPVKKRLVGSMMCCKSAIADWIRRFGDEFTELIYPDLSLPPMLYQCDL